MDAFSAIADPTRRSIIEALSGGDKSFGELAERYDISRPAVSQHLKVLRDAGLVESRAAAQRRIYRLRDNGLDDLERWLEHVRAFWNPRLDRLHDAIAESQEQEHSDE